MNIRIPKFGSRLARRNGARLERNFIASPWTKSASRSLPADVYTLAGRANLGEVVLMWRSLVTHVGRPQRFILIGDGTLDDHDFRHLADNCPGIETTDWRAAASLPPHPLLNQYCIDHPLGKKLALLMSLNPAGPTMFVDADVLFFMSAAGIEQQFREEPRYMIDCHRSLDSRLLNDAADDAAHPINSGVLMFTRPLDWSTAIERLANLQSPAERFTEQTLVHLAMHQSNGIALDGERFVLRVDDQFLWADRCDPRAAVLRHYVGPVRHKMWIMARRLGLLG